MERVNDNEYDDEDEEDSERECYEEVYVNTAILLANGKISSGLGSHVYSTDIILDKNGVDCDDNDNDVYDELVVVVVLF